jgi:hypothetical protein
MKIIKLGKLYFMTGKVNRKHYATYGATINDCFKMLENKINGGGK